MNNLKEFVNHSPSEECREEFLKTYQEKTVVYHKTCKSFSKQC